MKLFGFGKKESPQQQKGQAQQRNGSPTPHVYRERSATNFQEEELSRLRGSGRSGHDTQQRPPGARSTPPVAQAPMPEEQTGASSSAGSGGDDGERDRQFETLKGQLAVALQEGDSDRIIEGYRNLGQHFMAGKTLAEQQAAKQMFEKALQHAGHNSNGLKSASPAPTTLPAPSPPPQAAAQSAQGVPAGWTRKTVQLERALLPGMPMAPDGLAGVGFSFDTLPSGLQIVSAVAPTGSAAASGQVLPGDVLKSVDGNEVRGLAPPEVIRLVKGAVGTTVVLVLDSRNKDRKSPSPPPAAAQNVPLPLPGPSAPAEAPAFQAAPVIAPPLAPQQADPVQMSEPSSTEPAPPAPPIEPVPSAPTPSAQIVQPRQQMQVEHQPHSLAPETQPSPAEAAEKMPMQPPSPLQPPSQALVPEIQPPSAEAPEKTPVQPPPQPLSFTKSHVYQSPSATQDHESKSKEDKRLAFQMPPEPGLPAPQNPVVGTSTPSRPASPSLATQQLLAAPQRQHTSAQMVQVTPVATRKRGKRLVLTREPAKGQVVLPEHPVGVGLNLSSNDGGGAPFVVDSLLPASPAATCGQVQAGDVVYSIDGVRVKDKLLTDVIQMLKGPSGTQVTVVFQLNDSDVQTPMPPSRVQAFEARLEILAAEGLPTSNTSETGLSDPYVCVSLLPQNLDLDAGSALVLNHKRHSQANTKTCRKTLNPIWKESHIIRAMHTESVVNNSNRPLPSAHERTPLSGQGFTVMFTVHSENAGNRDEADEFIGSAFLRNMEAGPSTEFKLPMVDPRGHPVGFSGQAAMLHVRLAYVQVEGDAGLVHQAEAARKAAEMAASRKRREVGPDPVASANRSPYASGTARQPARTYTRPENIQESPSQPTGLASLWMQAHNTLEQRRPEGEMQMDASAFVPQMSLMSTPLASSLYGDQRARAMGSMGKDTQANFSPSMLEQIRLEMEEKDRELVTLRTEHCRLREKLHTLSQVCVCVCVCVCVLV